jgi:hypothetical protein
LEVYTITVRSERGNPNEVAGATATAKCPLFGYIAVAVAVAPAVNEEIAKTRE